MKFATIFDADNREQVAVLHNGEFHALAALGFAHPDMINFIAAYTPALGREIAAKAETAGKGMPVAEAKLQAPIPRPRHDILCIGQNYTAHAIESMRYQGKEYIKPDHPTYFSKRVGLPVGHGGCIPAHADATEKLDYESELAVIYRQGHGSRPAGKSL